MTTIGDLRQTLVKFSFSEKATKRQIRWVITPIFCGLLRKAELYIPKHFEYKCRGWKFDLDLRFHFIRVSMKQMH